MKSGLPTLLIELERRSKLIGVLFASAFVAVLDVASIALIVPILLIVVRPGDSKIPAPFDIVTGASPDTATLHVLAAILIASVLLKNLAMTLLMWVQTRVGAEMSLRLSQRMLRGYLAAPLEFHLGRKQAQYIRGIKDLPGEICLNGWLNYCNRIGEIAGVVAIVAALAMLEPFGMAAASALLLVLVWANHRLLGHRWRAWSDRNSELSRKTYGLVAGVFQNMRVVKTTDAGERMREKFGAVFVEGAYLAAKSRFAQMAIRPVSEIAMMAAGAIILTSLMWGRDRAIEAVPFLAAFTYAIFRLLPAINRISGNTNELRRIEPLVDEVNADLEATRPWLGDEAAGRRAATICFARSLELRGAGYRYPGGQGPALGGVDLTIGFGEVIGLAGASGAGKSTLVDLLLGLHEPAEGEILVDGQPPRRDGLTRGSVGYVPQNSLLLDVSARENIAFGVRPGDIDDAKVAEAVSAARLEETIAALPGGLDGEVGEHGSRLSGGQRQRFGIARALYGRPSLLVLDEATSDLDTLTEFEIASAINALRGKTTIVLVAHRMHILKSCDRIVFLQDGRIAATGSYDELLKSCPAFRELATMTEKYGTPGQAAGSGHLTNALD